MSKIRSEHYSLSVADLETPEQTANRLNFILSHIQDRLAQLEGTRGTSTIQAPVDIIDTDGNIVGGFTDVSAR